jgi:hypothetical protein
MNSNYKCSYMARSSLTYNPCFFVKIFFELKQQWIIEEISIFSNSSLPEWRAGLSDTILKGTQPGTIPARFDLIWFKNRKKGG